MKKKRKKSKLNTANKRSYKVNREHKSSLFCLSFREKKYLLEIYNAMNGTDYRNPEELTVCTLEDAVYIGIKNDISFLLGEMLNLYEHQSTQNPNMPMRGLLYLARNYEAYIVQNELNMYGTAQIKFPLPQYFVFYNGREDEPDKRELKLTDAFPEIKGKASCLECKATLLNINYGHNVELMEKCKRLQEYAVFIHRIRENQAKGMELTDAVDRAIDGCIREDILKDLLVKSRAEVRNMVLSTFNKEQYERDLKKEAERKGLEEGRAKGLLEGREEGREEGRAEGRAEGREEGRAEGLTEGERIGKEKMNTLYEKLMKSGRMEEMSRAFQDEVYREKLLREFSEKGLL